MWSVVCWVLKNRCALRQGPYPHSPVKTDEDINPKEHPPAAAKDFWEKAIHPCRKKQTDSFAVADERDIDLSSAPNQAEKPKET